MGPPPGLRRLVSAMAHAGSEGLCLSALVYQLQIPSGLANGNLDTICKNWNKAILV